MSSRQRDKYRKFDSGHQKRVKKLKLEKKQRDALSKFVFSLNILERIVEVSNETENYEGELMLDSNIEQPCCSKEFVTQNSIEVVEKYSDLTINNKIVDETKEAGIDFRDPAQWLELLTHDTRVEIVLSKSEKIEIS